MVSPETQNALSPNLVLVPGTPMFLNPVSLLNVYKLLFLNLDHNLLTITMHTNASVCSCEMISSAVKALCQVVGTARS